MARSMRRVSRATFTCLLPSRRFDSWHAMSWAKWSAPPLRLPTVAFTSAANAICIASARAAEAVALYHEAGHAVIAIALDLKIDKVGQGIRGRPHFVSRQFFQLGRIASTT